MFAQDKAELVLFLSQLGLLPDQREGDTDQI